ncbi:Nramp family divalent metal transporter [Sphingomonas canadensis]|uniref:Nramp family divalent metal transporter n=1 Tax=Sphingomonas canadensis TaxID=1219257 RepID=A0ABW3HF54_9SPHN|nr:Nramp family divalent metal transporter [Sphingomonas canadensis]MCW3837858.1 Nramp family divalent metal transporter [Sphingomonas canadensis]
MEDSADGNLHEFAVAELPPPPASTWRIIGPGVVAAGVGLASGEFILFPYIASKVGLVFVWAAAVGLITQFFINMEIERYTLATGETVLTGFSRLGRHWGLFFAALALVANLWPGWMLSSATLTTYLFGGDARTIAIVMLVAMGLILTLSPVVYRALEGTQFLKVAAVLALILIAALFAIPGDLWGKTPALVADVRIPAEALGWPLLMGAMAYAGAGGGQNLCQSNWIRDKGFGMGIHAPRIVSPLTGEPQAAPGTGWRFVPDAENLARWRDWWRFANTEQLVTFVAISFVTILFTSLLAHATLGGQGGLANNIGFLRVEGVALSASVGGWFGTLFWAVGAFSLFAAALGIVDYTARLAADVLRTSYLKTRNESILYAMLVWAIVATGIAILASGLDQPLVLLVVSGCIAAFMMFFYSILLIRLGRLLDPALRPRPYRLAAMGWAVLLFGALSAITIVDQAGRLMR